MKRNEMIKKLENNFKNIFVSVDTDGDLYIRYESMDTNEIICCVQNNKQYKFSVYNDYYMVLGEEEQKKLFDIIVEYSATPIEEREEEPRYQYYIPQVQGLELNPFEKYNICLNYRRDNGNWYFRDDENNEDFQTVFTDKELKRYGIDPQELRSKYSWIKIN